jgi:hypothetical protein
MSLHYVTSLTPASLITTLRHVTNTCVTYPPHYVTSHNTCCTCHHTTSCQVIPASHVVTPRHTHHATCNTPVSPAKHTDDESDHTTLITVLHFYGDWKLNIQSHIQEAAIPYLDPSAASSLEQRSLNLGCSSGFVLLLIRS